jgi:hypothetical protein
MMMPMLDWTLWSSLTRIERRGPYSNAVSIIQSSGTGKSRMVDELSRSVFTIPFNIRSSDENRGISLRCCDYINLKFSTVLASLSRHQMT